MVRIERQRPLIDSSISHNGNMTKVTIQSASIDNNNEVFGMISRKRSKSKSRVTSGGRPEYSWHKANMPDVIHNDIYETLRRLFLVPKISRGSATGAGFRVSDARKICGLSRPIVNVLSAAGMLSRVGISIPHKVMYVS